MFIYDAGKEDYGILCGCFVVRGKLTELEMQAKRLNDAATNAVSAEMDTADAIS
jgi:hypothetical protein